MLSSLPTESLQFCYHLTALPHAGPITQLSLAYLTRLNHNSTCQVPSILLHALSWQHVLLSYAAESQVVPTSAQSVRDTHEGQKVQSYIITVIWNNIYVLPACSTLFLLYTLPAPNRRGFHETGLCLSLQAARNLKIVIAWLKTGIVTLNKVRNCVHKRIYNQRSKEYNIKNTLLNIFKRQTE